MVNIYDDEDICRRYLKIRNNQFSANDIIEVPHIKELLPKTSGLKVLDLGCGNGNYDLKFFRNVKKLDAIDSSKRMLNEFSQQLVKNKLFQFYLHHTKVENYSYPEGKYDLVFSTLLFHHISHLDEIISNVHKSLKKNGLFLFSVMHPLFMCCRPLKQSRKDSVKMKWTIEDYFKRGKRAYIWLGKPVVKYHHLFSDYTKALISNHFQILDVREPSLPTRFIDKSRKLGDFKKNPVFLIFLSKKNE